MSASHTSLSNAADERKSRLAKYRSLKRKQPGEDDAPATLDEDSFAAAENGSAKPAFQVSGRNYDPETRGPKLGFEAPPVDDDAETLEKQAEKLELEVKEKAEEDAQDDKGVDLFKLQPKKPNWDLKRELNQKMEVLNTRTDNAIARLVRERLGANKSAQESSVSQTGAEGGAAVVMEGAELVESIRVREQEALEEQRKEREADDLAGE